VAGVRIAALLMCGPALVLSVLVGLTQGNPLAWGMAVGFASPVIATWALVLVPAKPLPRKADPAKSARLERELGMEPSEAPTTVAVPE
jgi:hypothetical protein